MMIQSRRMQPLRLPGRVGLVLLMLTAAVAAPRTGRAGAGVSNDFETMNPGARTAGLGETAVAMTQDSELLFANPAGLVTLINPQIGLSHLAWWEGVSYQGLWGVQPLGPKASVGMDLNFLRVEPFNSTNDPDIASSQAWMLRTGGAYAIKLMRSLALGGKINLAWQDMDSRQAFALAMDLGAQYYLLNDHLTLGLTLANLGFATPFIQKADLAPMHLCLGAAYQWWPDDPDSFTLLTQATQPFSDDLRVAVALEGKVWNDLFIRAAWRSQADSGDWLVFGAGFKWKSIMIDYAISPLGTLGVTHQISLKYDFGSQRRVARPKLEVTLISKQFVNDQGEARQEIHLIPKSQIAAGLKKWKVTIKDRQGKVVRLYQGDDKLPLEVVWDGLDSRGVATNAENYYRYQFEIVDKLGYTAEQRGEILPVSITKLPKLKALPRDIFAGQVSFSTSNTRKIKSWVITIVNDDGRVLKKYQGKGIIPKDFAWDGTDEQNRKVALKKGYQFILQLTDEHNNEIKSVAPIVVVNADSKAKTKKAIPLPEEVRFQFQFSAASPIKSWTLDIIESDTGRVVRNLQGEGALPDRLMWDTRDNHGHVVPSNKSYSYVLRLQDALGNIWRQAEPLRSTDVEVLKTGQDGTTVKIEQILFDFNKAELKTEMHEKLRKTADIVKAYGEDKVKLLIEGHTDDVGSEQFNLDLSQKRAQMVMRYLVEEEGLPSSVIVMKGYGKSQPLTNNNGPLSRTLNRRVEITIVLPKEKP